MEVFPLIHTQAVAANQVGGTAGHTETLHQRLQNTNPTQWVSDVNQVRSCNMIEFSGRQAQAYNVDPVDVDAVKRTAEEADFSDEDGGIEQTSRTIKVASKKKPKAPAKPRVPKPLRRLKGLTGAPIPDIVKVLNSQPITITPMQLAQIHVKSRRQLSKALQLEPEEGAVAKKSSRKPQPQTVEFTTSSARKVPRREETSGDDMEISQVERGNRQRRETRGQVANTVVDVCNLKLVRRKAQENFYTKALVSNPDTEIPFRLTQVLIDPGAVVNLISEDVADRCGLEKIVDTSLEVKGWTGQVTSIPCYTRINLEVAGVMRRIVAYVFRGNDCS